MGLWFLALVLVVLIVAWGIIATSRRWPEATHGWPVLIILRLIGIVVVTAVVALAATTIGPVAAAVSGVLGVGIFVWLLVRTGYARLPLPRR